jgi:hypothetical protein
MTIDLSKIEGLTAEQISAITAANDVDIKELKDNNASLLDEKKIAQSAVEAEKTRANAAAEEAAQAKIDKATKDKDFDALTLALSEKDGIIAKQKAEFAQSEKKRIIDTAAKDFLSKHVIRDDPAASAYMEAEYKKGLDVRDGSLVNINEAGVTGVSIENYSNIVVSNDSYSKYVVGTQSSGGGANGGHSNGRAVTKTFGEMTRTEQSVFANENPIEYKNQSTTGE